MHHIGDLDAIKRVLVGSAYLICVSAARPPQGPQRGVQAGPSSRLGMMTT